MEKKKCDKHGLTNFIELPIETKMICSMCVVDAMTPLSPRCPEHDDRLDKNNTCTICYKTYDICQASFDFKRVRCIYLKNHAGPHMSPYCFKWTDEYMKKFDIKTELIGSFRRAKYDPKE